MKDDLDPPDALEPADEARGQRAVQSVEVGGRLLLALAASPGPMTLKDLAAAAGLQASRAHPYLVSFGRLRFVEQHAATGRYALGPAALQLGLACLQQLDPLRVATPVADELAARTGYAVALSVWGNVGPTVVHYTEARQPLHVVMRAGTVMSILGTATGRAYAAALPPDQVRPALARVVAALGDTPTPDDIAGSAGSQESTESMLMAARDELATHGVTRAAGRPIPGVNAFSAPAYDHEGTPVLVITALGHQDRFDVAWNSAAAQAVRQAAAEVSGRLGWRTRG